MRWFKSSNGSTIDVTLTNNSHFLPKSQSFETRISDHYHLICVMLKLNMNQCHLKSSLIGHSKTFFKNSLKKLSRKMSDFS